MSDDAVRRWFLAPDERGNPATEIDQLGEAGKSWVEGNLVRPLIHGATYFRRLYEELSELEPGDRVYFTDWRGDADELLLPDGPTVGDVLRDVVRAGVEVRGLLWRSHSDHVQFNAQENQRLGTELNEVGAEVLLDQRVRRLASHHHKLFVIRHRGDPERDVAFVGGIDLSHGRRDDADHAGDPQTAPMDPRYGDRAPWHDAALELRGPVVGDLLRTFVERWDDGHPSTAVRRTGPSSSVSPGCRATRSRCLRISLIHRRPGRTPYRCCGRTPTSARAIHSRRRGSGAWLALI